LNFSIPDESILEAVAKNEVMMGLVNRVGKHRSTIVDKTLKVQQNLSEST